MDSNFQTSFIPKKPLVEDRLPERKTISILSFVGTLIFFATVAATVGVYVYKVYLTQSVASMTTDLDRAKASFEPGLITDLQSLDKRLLASKELLDKHLVFSPLFQAVSGLTLKSVQFTKFNYSIEDPKDTIVAIQMSGIATNYASIALESDVLSQNKAIKDPVFSNLNLDPKGGVGFDLTFTVDKSFLSYESAVALTQSQ